MLQVQELVLWEQFRFTCTATMPIAIFTIELTTIDGWIAASNRMWSAEIESLSAGRCRGIYGEALTHAKQDSQVRRFIYNVCARFLATLPLAVSSTMSSARYSFHHPVVSALSTGRRPSYQKFVRVYTLSGYNKKCQDSTLKLHNYCPLQYTALLLHVGGLTITKQYHDNCIRDL